MGTAVFYDMENVGLNAGEAGNGSVAQVLERIRTSPLVDKIVLQRGYTARPVPEHLAESLAEYGVELAAISPALQRGKRKPNQVDLKMCTEIPALVLRRPSLSTIVIVTGDGDFRFLLELLRERGKKVVLVTGGMSSATALLRSCDDWIDMRGKQLSRREMVEIWCSCLGKRDYRGTDFLLALGRLLDDSVEIPLLRRFLWEERLELVVLRTIMAAYTQIPGYAALGYRSWTDMAIHALSGSNFCVVMAENGSRQVVRPLPGEGEPVNPMQSSRWPQPYSPLELYKGMLGVGPAYSPNRMRQWIKNLSRHSKRQLGELIDYLRLMEQNGLLTRDEEGGYLLPTQENYAQRLIGRLHKELKGAGAPIDEQALGELEKIL